METISFNQNDRSIQVPVIRSKRRSVSIVIDPNNGVSIRAPFKPSVGVLTKLVEDKTNWVFHKLSELEGFKRRYPEKEYVSGDVLLYLGKNISIHVQPHARIKKPHVSYYKGIFIVNLKEGLTDSQRKNTIKKLMTAWFKERARLIFRQRIEHFSKILGVRPRSMKLTNAKSRWGSCTAKGTVRISWKLIMAPIEILDYVIVHELCHIKRRDHSNEYWKLVTSIIPNWKELRNRLKKESALYTL